MPLKLIALVLDLERVETILRLMHYRMCVGRCVLHACSCQFYSIDKAVRKIDANISV
jgi:hypothetical protein